MFVVYGLVCTLFPFYPLWVDELTLVDNLKFKSPTQLWGDLDHVQQFPRVYMQLLKAWCTALDYSYFSLRFPAFLVHCTGLLILWKLSASVFGKRSLQRFVWLLLFLSYYTSLHYFFYVKQYTMEMALGLVGIWQLMEIMKNVGRKPSAFTMLLICLGFAIGPFFSYTYPIVIAPIYIVVCLEAWRTKRLHWSSILPLILGLLSVAIAYWIDVRHVLEDGGMQEYWKPMMAKSFDLKNYVKGIFMLFSNLGPGDLFGAIFGVIGIACFIHSSYLAWINSSGQSREHTRLLQYTSLLVWMIIALFIMGKLPLGSFRLTAFAVPSIGILILHSIKQLLSLQKWRPIALGIYSLIVVICVGCTFSVMFEVIGKRNVKQVRIYNTTRYAIEESINRNLPLLVTSKLAYPYEGYTIANWVLKTHPNFPVAKAVRYYMLETLADKETVLRNVPDSISTFILLHGDSVSVVGR